MLLLFQCCLICIKSIERDDIFIKNNSHDQANPSFQLTGLLKLAKQSAGDTAAGGGKERNLAGYL
jgi:hypothetical protein